MKKRTLYSLLMIGMLSFSSCNDFLDKEPLDTLTDNPDFWTNEASVDAYANAFYNQFVGYGQSGNGDFYFPTLNDNQAGSGFVNWKYTNSPASNSNWSATWDEIRRSNVMINSLNEYAAGVMDQATFDHYIGIARLMRAYQYWDLVRKFGDAPYTEEVVDLDSPVLYGPREDRDMIMDKVLEDLNFAVAHIQGGSQTTFSADMAQAFKARICLWEGTFRKYRVQGEGSTKGPDQAGAEKFLNACVDACNAIMGKYTLCDDYQSLYNSVDLAGNSEIIFYKRYLKDIMGHSTIDYTCTSTEQNGMSKDAFDAYLKLDGTLAVEGVDDIGEMLPSDNDLLGGKHMNIRKVLDNRDKRLAASIDTVLAYQGTGRGWSRVLGGAAMTSSTGYTVSKYDNVDLEMTYRETGGRNYTSCPLFWLAEVYLNYAEAKAELGTITNTDLDNTINKLKDRAGLPHITTAVADMRDAYAKAKGTDPLVYEIRRERRCELMFDNDFRYWDLIRWHELDRLDTQKNPNIVRGANLTPDAGNTLDLINGYIDASNGMDRVYDPKHYLYPLPTTQFTLNPALEQNPGWSRTSEDEEE